MKVKALLYSDGSERSLSAAIYTAVMMKADPTMEVTVVTITKTGPDVSWDGWFDSTAFEGIGQDILTRTRKIFEARKLDVRTIEEIENDKIARQIVDYADKGGYNMIIMRTKGPSELRALFQGSLAYDVVQLSTCPVLLVRKLPDEMLACLED
jgi:nucleotide-binding universal stress UspA family protein